MWKDFLRNDREYLKLQYKDNVLLIVVLETYSGREELSSITLGSVSHVILPFYHCPRAVVDSGPVISFLWLRQLYIHILIN